MNITIIQIIFVTAYTTELNFCNVLHVFLFLKLFRSVKLIQTCKNLYCRKKSRNIVQGTAGLGGAPILYPSVLIFPQIQSSSLLRAVVHLVFLVDVPWAGGLDSHGDGPVLPVVDPGASYRIRGVISRGDPDVKPQRPCRSVHRAVTYGSGDGSTQGSCERHRYCSRSLSKT